MVVGDDLIVLFCEDEYFVGVLSSSRRGWTVEGAERYVGWGGEGLLPAGVCLQWKGCAPYMPNTSGAWLEKRKGFF